jgi:cAMP-dependent protein kinase regulator
MFYIVEEGKAVVTKTIEVGKPPQVMMRYTKGSYFGELALIKEAPRAANVIAEVDNCV